MTKVSVIIPTYNRAKFVTKAIDSVLAQTYKDYEIIVVDDGSTDNTKEALEPYMDKITYIYQENEGVSAARNKGIKVARDEWIAFLDSDDEWLPEKLAVQMGAVLGKPHLCAHVTNAFFDLPDGSKSTIFDFANIRNLYRANCVIDRPFSHILNSMILITSSTIINRYILDDVGLFDTHLSIGEDTDFFLRIALKGPWGVDCHALARISQKNKSESLRLTHKAQLDKYSARENIVYMLSKFKGNPKLTKEEKQIVRKKLSWNLYMLGIFQMRRGTTKQAQRNFKDSFFVYPSIKSFIRLVLSGVPGCVGIDLYERYMSRKMPSCF